METRLVVFDWDGVLARMPVPYSWYAIDKTLGCTSEMSVLEKKFRTKQITYRAWCEESVAVYKRFGLTKQKLESIIASNLSLADGALDTIKELRKKGIKTAIISGAVYNMYEYACRNFGLRVDYASFTTKLNFDRDGQLAGGDYNDYDYGGKVIALKRYCDEIGCSLDSVVYVGDADNDIEIFKVTRGVAFMSNSENLKREAKHVISGKDLRDLLKYVQ